MFENNVVREYRDNKVIKEALDKCSTCELNTEMQYDFCKAKKGQREWK